MDERAKYTPGPWQAFNMVHAERGDAMTPEEIGEYVANSVRKTVEGGGSLDRFLFISVDGDGPDICHVGNGPAGPYNARLIAAAPELLEALEDIIDTGFCGGPQGRRAKKAIAKALGQEGD